MRVLPHSFERDVSEPAPPWSARSNAFAFIAAATLLFFTRAGGDEDQDWPMWGYDAARSGTTSMEIPEDLHLQWTRQLPAPSRAWPAQLDDADKLEFDLSYSPVVLGDRLFVGSMNNDSLAAYRIEDGGEIWRHYVDGPVRLAPAAADGKVFFVSDDGHLYCVDAASGERLWRFRAAPTDRLVLGNNRLVSMWAARGGPVVKDGTVYFAAGVWPFMGTFVYALDAESGEVVWQNTGDSTNWQAQPHGGAFSFAGIAPQGYLAATADRLVVSGGRSPAALLDRHTGEIISLDIEGKEFGGYRVRADDEHYYVHGDRFRLEDGEADGKGDLGDEDLQERAETLADELGAELHEAIAARGRVFLSLSDGRLLCYGADPVEAPPTLAADGEAAKSHREIVDRPVDDPRVRTILDEAGPGGENVLFLGVGDGELLEEVAVRTGLHVVGIDSDEEKIQALRERFDRAGLYGKDIALLSATPSAAAVPPYIFSFIVVDEPDAVSLEESTVHDLLRPYGGKAFFGPDRVVSRDGPLPGAGEWTHQYADAARTAVSRDELVRAPLGVLWYGSESHDNILPRHAIGPRPHIVGGRLVILGVETISARDVYTGRELWVREFPGIGHPFTDMELEEKWSEGTSVYMTNIPGTAYIGSPYVTLADSLYLRYRGKIHHLDPATGESRGEFPLYPEGHRIDPNDYGNVSVSGDLIVTTTGPHLFDDAKLGWLESWNATSSRHLVVMNRHTGEKLWEREAEIGFRHNAIVAGDDRIFVIDGVSEKALEFLSRRGTLPEENSRVIALDADTGRELWSTESEVFGTYLAFSEEHDILMESGSRDTRRPLSDEPASKAIARHASSGKVLWEDEMEFPAAIRGDILIPGRPGRMLNIVTGEEVPEEHPITGELIPETYAKFYGCGAANVSTHMVMYRSGSAGFLDEDQCGTANLGGFKSGCTANMIAADGILNAPDYTRTCTCSYQNQTSLGLIHMPEADLWTSVTVGRGEEGIRRLGINLGAPGNRRAPDGTLWTPFPLDGAPAPELKVRLLSSESAPAPNRIVSLDPSDGESAASLLDGDGSTGWNVTCDRKGKFNESITLGLEKAQRIDHLEIAWKGPRKTRFRIEAKGGDGEWIAVAEDVGKGTGNDGERKTYRFEPIETRELRLGFLEHGGTGKDGRGRPLATTAAISDLRVGGLEWRAAHAYFLPQEYHRRHPLEIDGTNGLNWVAASGVDGIREFILDDIRGDGDRYTVTLHFAEFLPVETGARVFDLRVQGETVASAFDPVKRAGGPRRAVTVSAKGVVVDDSLRVELLSTDGSRLPPILGGIELARED
ncbi:MAG: PQQ-binding-like beta-propeller repeat protein [Verrucomicrobiales bacterium]